VRPVSGPTEVADVLNAGSPGNFRNKSLERVRRERYFRRDKRRELHDRITVKKATEYLHCPLIKRSFEAVCRRRAIQDFLPVK